MQKKIIALAVAALASGAALAQSNVTIYGVADMYIGSVNVGNGTKTTTAVNSGGLSASRIGFRGTEDLGNGLKAVFNFEYGLALDDHQTTPTVTSTVTSNAIDMANNPATTTVANTTTARTGNGIGNARQEMVGLTGGFGTVAAGFLQTTGYDWGVKFGGSLAGSAMSPLQNLTTSAGLIGATNATAARLGNAVAYISPDFAGFKAAINYSAAVGATESVANPNANTTAWMASGTYENGPIAAGLVYAKANSPTANSDRNDWALGGSYDFKVAKLSATYQTTKLDAVAGPASNRDKVYSVSLAVPVTAAGAVHFQYAKNSIASTAAADNTSGYALAYTHGLSKRTTAYAGYSRMNNGAGAQVGIANNGIAPVVGDQNASVLAAGIRHSF